MAARYGLTDEEVAAGYVLTCQSVPGATASRWITTPDFANRHPMLTETDAKARGACRSSARPERSRCSP